MLVLTIIIRTASILAYLGIAILCGYWLFEK